MDTIDSHVHLFAKVNANGIASGPTHPLFKDKTLDVLLEHVRDVPSSKHRVRGFVAIEADGLTGNKSALPLAEACATAHYEYLTWLRVVQHAQLPLEGTTAEGRAKIKGVVPWIPASDGPQAVAKMLDTYKSSSPQDYARIVKGVRFLFQDKDPGTQLNDKVAQSINYVAQERGLVFDLGIDMAEGGLWQFGEFVELLHKTSGVTYIINHLTKPAYALKRQEKLADGGAVTAHPDFQHWVQYVKEIAGDKNNHSYIKLSGAFDQLPLEVSEETQRATQYVAPWFRVVWDLWGPDRVIFGSDWPVCTAKSEKNTYARWLDIAETLLAEVGASHEDREKVFYRNVVKAYNLEVD